MAARNKPARFLKTRENTSGNLKQRGPKSWTVRNRIVRRKRAAHGLSKSRRRRKVMSRRIVAILAVVFAVVCGAAAFVWLHAGGQSKTVVYFTPDPAPATTAKATPETNPAPLEKSDTATVAKPASAPAAPEPGVAPVSGEVLEFSGSVAKVSNVANLRLLVNGRKQIGGKDAWHLQAYAHTQNPLRMVFELDDQFDSYSAPGDFTSVQYEMHLSERGQKVQSIQRMTPTGREAAPAGATAARVVPGTRDPLGTMQYLRSVDWARTPEVRGPVYDGRKLYDVVAKKIGSADVVVPAGKFSTSVVEIKVFDNGAEMKDAHFTLYLAKDAAHTPVLLEALLPFAAARVELTKKQ
jgi:cytoskeletal protein RodZ